MLRQTWLTGFLNLTVLDSTSRAKYRPCEYPHIKRDNLKLGIGREGDVLKQPSHYKKFDW